MLRRTKTYTFQEFYNLENTRQINKIEYELSKIARNKKLWNTLVYVVAILLSVTGMAYASPGAAGIAAIGNKAYNILLDVAAWYAIIGCGIDLLKCGLNGTTGNVGKVLINYLMIYTSIAMLPWLIETIKGVLF